MGKEIEVFQLSTIPKDELLAFAVKMVKEYANAAQLTHEKMSWILSSMITPKGELIKEKFFLFWWERRHFFFQLYYLRFYQFQVRSIPKGKIVLTFRQYAEETGDYLSKEIYRDRLPSIFSNLWQNLHALHQNDFKLIQLQ